MKRLKLLSIALLSIMFVFQASAQDDEQKDSKKKYRQGTHHNFEIDLGINNWLEDDKFPNDNNSLYSVRPWGSWYVALNAINDTHVAGPLHLEWGVGASWYNFKFENEDVRVGEGTNQVVFYEAASDIESTKSKLTASYVNVSFVPVIKLGNQDDRDNHEHRNHRHRWNWDNFGEHEGGFRLGIGGYAGYKLASYTKTVVDDRNREKDHDGFYLNNLRYGVRVQMGFRGLDLFANYDLNDMFVENKGPQLNAFSFGVIL